MDNEKGSDTNQEDDLYSFETDHLALRDNKDYSVLMKSLVILCSLRKRAIEDCNKVVQLKKEALEDPLKVLDKIVKGEPLGIPEMYNVPELPHIDWSKYDVTLPKGALEEIYMGKQSPEKKPDEKRQSKQITGRWTIEEQKQLEKLLQTYPVEAVEMNRYKKIATALGTKDYKQVTSRVQKYFKKLYKANLPIPGRIPKSAERHRKSNIHKHQRHNEYLRKPSTFFPDLIIPVTIDDNAPGPSTKIPDLPSTSTSNYLLSSNYIESIEGPQTQKDDTQLQMELLMRVRKEKLRESSESNSLQYRHIGYQCNHCNEDPIVGTRWHCITCQRNSVDFCTDCVIAQVYSHNCHPLSHQLVTYRDRDNYESDSDSNGASGSCSVDNNHEMSDSSDSDDEDDECDVTVNEGNQEDEMMNDQLFDPKLDTGLFNDVNISDDVSLRFA